MTIDEVVGTLEAIYADHPDGIDRRDDAALELRDLGTAIDRAGGLALMRSVHQSFAAKNRRHARNLEMRWNGIGDWLG